MQRDELREQIDYYRARAQEYDESISFGRFDAAADRLNEPSTIYQWGIETLQRRVSTVDTTLELACGTGLWTEQLLKIAHTVTVVDASPEMLDVNRSRFMSGRVNYMCADIFDWTPDQTYDLVSSAFWLSHVPPELLMDFLTKIRGAVDKGGIIHILDQWTDETDEELANPAVGIYQSRVLNDGRQFRIVKVYYDPEEITAKLERVGFTSVARHQESHLFSMVATRVD